MTDRQPIDEFIEVTHAIARHQHLAPDGERSWTHVTNPCAHSKANPPSYLRVRLPRKSVENFNVIETIHDLGLRIGDVWQLDYDGDDDVVLIRVDKPAADAQTVVDFLESYFHDSLERDDHQTAAQAHVVQKAIERRYVD